MISGHFLRHLRGLVARYELRACAEIGDDARVNGKLWIHGDGDVVLGDRVMLDARTAPIEIHAFDGARIVIGNDVTIGGGTSIEATCSYVIGARVRIGSFCKLLDSHFHALTGDRHAATLSGPILCDWPTSHRPRRDARRARRAHRGRASRPAHHAHERYCH